MRERDRVDERLERGTDLPVRRRQGAIELALRVIASADKSAKLQAIVEQSRNRSAVFDMLTNGTDVTLSVNTA